MGSCPDTDIDPFYLYIPCGTNKENFSNNQELLKLAIISLNLLTLTFDSGAILREEIIW